MQTFKLTRDVAEGILADLDIDKLARGETLSAEQFIALSESLKNAGITFTKGKKAGK